MGIYGPKQRAVLKVKGLDSKLDQFRTKEPGGTNGRLHYTRTSDTYATGDSNARTTGKRPLCKVCSVRSDRTAVDFTHVTCQYRRYKEWPISFGPATSEAQTPAISELAKWKPSGSACCMTELLVRC